MRLAPSHTRCPSTASWRSTPDRPAVTEVGDPVAVGETLGLVEAMKTFTPITAEVAVRILAFHSYDEDAAMPGQPLVDIAS